MMATVDKDEVFVQMLDDSVCDMPLLEWIFDHFENDKTEIIIICWSFKISQDNFTDIARSTFLPRCDEKKFEARILVPEGAEINERILETFKKHGTKKLVLSTYYLTRPIFLAKVFENPNLSCKIWFIDNHHCKLISERSYGPDPDLRTAYRELENFKMIANEETIKRQEIEGKIYLMTEQAKTKEELLKKEKEENDHLLQSAPTSFNLTSQELEQATQTINDSLKIGEGQFGSMYESSFRGTAVAIKKFKSDNEKSLSMFQQEVDILSTVRHPNIITLIGACSEPPALVYEFLLNGSLHDYLNHAGKTSPLPWQLRTRIIYEICKALVYLHSNKPNPIVHGDLKPDNIFFDGNFTSKLSGFGRIKHVQTNTTTIGPSNLDAQFPYRDPEFLPSNLSIQFPYMDPEFLTTNEMTSESDVFSFGVIILHLLTGRPSSNIAKDVQEAMQKDEFCAKIDVSAGSWPFEDVIELAKIGIKCADASRSNRPNLVNEVWPIIKSFQHRFRDLHFSGGKLLSLTMCSQPQLLNIVPHIFVSVCVVTLSLMVGTKLLCFNSKSLAPKLFGAFKLRFFNCSRRN